MAKGRIPRAIKEFSAYLMVTRHYLPELTDGMPNWERLNLSADEKDKWIADANYFVDTLMPLHSGINTKTMTVNSMVRKFMKTFSKFAIPLLNRMQASFKRNENDATAFNFKLKRKKPSRMKTAIADTCYLSVKGKGQGMLIIVCRNEKGEGRSRLPERAKGVKLAYKIGEAPANVNECTMFDFFSGTHHRLQIDPKHTGKRIYIYACWINLSYPQFAGAYSQLTSIIIS